ncbi:hypothetical protein [Micromonospora aurantiaca (nom. illeg.)]|uniref:hypothetical protein n=1 Tax=Micromonospora aurantiaca (nom. illeg.) TaxID=47850 RepID=UPI001656CF94|nr:hypothetical protein [Micromonospora aurantiaca]MBC9001702.1 hypothetical protein [Micromonospora aurantiaca]
MPGGYITHANWTFGYSINTMQGTGLRLAHAHFDGRPVLFRGELAFTLVDHGPTHGVAKNGLGARGGGSPLVPLLPTAPNAAGSDLPPTAIATNDSQYDAAANPTGAVHVERYGPSGIEPAKVAFWAKFQAGDYQYVHRWELFEDGVIAASVGVGGRPAAGPVAGLPHTHHHYYRLDPDVATIGGNTVQLGTRGGAAATQWQNVARGAHALEPGSRLRVASEAPKPNGLLRSYELLPGSNIGPDGRTSSADLWVAPYRGNLDDGYEVGTDDSVLTSRYAAETGASVGEENDVSLWYALRQHVEPRTAGEEHRIVPYRFTGFRLDPRDFLDDTPNRLYRTSPPSP